MGWATRQKEKGTRLELTWFEPRSSWKKKHSSGRVKYFKHPDSADGYKAALQEWYQFEKQLLGLRKNSPQYEHNHAIFVRVQSWYDAFGIPEAERKLADQVSAFLKWIEELMDSAELPDAMPIGSFCLGGKRPEFYSEFVGGRTLLGTIHYELPPKWIDRLDRSANTAEKEPQTIGYWLEKYLNRVDSRGGKFIQKDTAKDRRYKLAHFSKHCDKLAHIVTITDQYIEKYHHAVDGIKLEAISKRQYFKAFRMFVRWCGQTSACDLVMPKNLDSLEFRFTDKQGTGRKRMKKKEKLWSPEDFLKTLAELPDPYPCYLMLMMNCGFRHVDLGELRKVDLRNKEKRIVIQRHKLNQQETAPVISYKLWDKTYALLKKAISTDPVYVFRNSRGGSVEDSIKSWWKDRPDHVAKGKTLDFIRKTGSTIVAKYDFHLDVMYLGECLSDTAKKHYSFIDGEPCPALDEAIQHLGSVFGFAQKTVRKVKLTPPVIEALTKAGIDVASLS